MGSQAAKEPVRDEPKCLNPGNIHLPRGLKAIADRKWHFRWIVADPKYSADERFVFNYKIVTISNEDFGDLVKSDPRVTAQGTIQHGDLILAFCDAREWKQRMNAQNNETARRVRASRRSAHTDIAKLAPEGQITSFEDDQPGAPGQAKEASK
jgi:ribosomal protein RSM22 (predicted rRNA methylase)